MSHEYARAEASEGLLSRAASVDKELDANQITRMRNVVDAELRAGGVGIGLTIGYVPGVSDNEIRSVFEQGAERSVPVFVHVRNPDVDSIEEAIDYARTTDSALHVMHINSMALGNIDAALELIAHAKTSGVDVTTEMYPYTAGSTYIETALFNEWMAAAIRNQLRRLAVARHRGEIDGTVVQ